MSIPSQSKNWSFAPQAAKAVDPAGLELLNPDYYRVYASNMQVGSVNGQEIFPLELSGAMTPTGVFKSQHLYRGQVDLFPRLENAFGWLLHAAFGNSTSTPGEDMHGNAVTGVVTHKFEFNTASEYYLPWFASRSRDLGRTAVENSGEIGGDLKMGSLALTIPAMGKITARIGFDGRFGYFDDTPNTWTYENELEDSTSVPDSGSSSLTIGGESYPLVGIVMELQNALSTDNEMIVGSFNPDDIIPLTRSLTFRIQYKYENAELCRLIYNGDKAALEWSSLPTVIQTDLTNPAAPVYALEAIFAAPAVIPGTTNKYRLGVRANKITIAKDGVNQTRPGSIVVESYTITVLDHPTLPYAEALLENAIPNYTWPTV